MRMLEIRSQDRPRERMFNLGPTALNDRELIALILRDGTRGSNAIDLASTLLAEFGSLHNLRQACMQEIAQVRGIGTAKAAALKAAFELADRYEPASDVSKNETIETLAQIACQKIGQLRNECVVVFILNNACRLLRIETVSQGAVDHTIFPVREILNLVLRYDGKRFAIAHNHPSGDSTPSIADNEATRELTIASGYTGLIFLGHIVVGPKRWQIATWERAS